MMYPTSRGLSVVVVLLAVAGSAIAEEAPLNLLFFGNSFSMQHGVAGRVKDLAAADGHASPIVVTDMEGGTDLDYHIGQVASNPYGNVNNGALPEGATWDFVVIQGYSTEATHLRDDPADNPFQQDALTLYQRVANHSTGNGVGVTGVLYQTWARPNLVTGSFPTLTAMQTEITSGYQAAYETIDAVEGAGTARIGAVGQAFELGGFDGSLYASDHYHASTKGGTLAALVLYRTIYEEDVSDIAYADVSSWVGVSSSDWSEITALADAAPIVTPEPASMSLLVGAGLCLLRRRPPSA